MGKTVFLFSSGVWCWIYVWCIHVAVHLFEMSCSTLQYLAVLLSLNTFRKPGKKSSSFSRAFDDWDLGWVWSRIGLKEGMAVLARNTDGCVGFISSWIRWYKSVLWTQLPFHCLLNAKFRKKSTWKGMDCLFVFCFVFSSQSFLK